MEMPSGQMSSQGHQLRKSKRSKLKLCKRLYWQFSTTLVKLVTRKRDINTVHQGQIVGALIGEMVPVSREKITI
jgi:protein-arginine kinase activator protein McsA